MKHLIHLLIVVAALCTFTGCSGVRFIVDAVPAEDELTETVVLEDSGARGWFGGGGAKIALIDVTGLIVDARKPGIIAPGENPVATLVESLHRARDDSAVKAVVLRINSPGGTDTASDVMYREVRHFKEDSGKPVVVLMEDVAASGGYYLACSGDEIIAHPTTITGSIGVIIQTINFSDGMRRIGIKADAIVSGPNKKMGSPFEPMPDEHRELLQGIVNEFYGNFVAIVKESRPALKETELAWITDGRVVTGVRAQQVGLVDSLGDMHDAFAAAKSRADVPSARLVKYHRPVEYVGSAYATAPDGAPSAGGSAGSQINLLQLNFDAIPGFTTSGFYYLWDASAW
jgi:protease-4